MIWERFIASLMAACVQDTVNVDITANGYLFKASGYTVNFDGYTVLYEEGKDEETEGEIALPEMKIGEVLKLKELTPNQHFTQPLPRYTEPTLIKALEENGIGRPSTYAPILTNIMGREYIEREKKALKPTELGKVVSDLMVEFFNKIFDVKFTAGLEVKLDKIGAGDLDWTETIANFYKEFENYYKKNASSPLEKIRSLISFIVSFPVYLAAEAAFPYQTGMDTTKHRESQKIPETESCHPAAASIQNSRSLPVPALPSEKSQGDIRV